MGKITRRKFLGCSAAALGGACLACGGASYWAAAAPQSDLIATSFSGEKIMNGKVLVTYASKCGSTGEIAKAVAGEIAARGVAADVSPAENVSDLAGYSAVVIGSAVRFGMWLAPASGFVSRFAEPLRSLPVAIFTAHIMSLGESAEARAGRQEYIQPVLARITPLSTAFFAGKVDPAKLSFLEKTIGRIVGSAEGDLRDWTKIRAWAAELPL